MTEKTYSQLRVGDVVTYLSEVTGLRYNSHFRVYETPDGKCLSIDNLGKSFTVTSVSEEGAYTISEGRTFWLNRYGLIEPEYVPPTARKIIQLSGDKALCEDGTAWVLREKVWHQLPEILV